MPQRIAWLKAQMKKNGYDKLIWSLEAGGPMVDVEGYDDKENARYVIKLFVSGIANGLEHLSWSLNPEGDFFWGGLNSRILHYWIRIKIRNLPIIHISCLYKN